MRYIEALDSLPDPGRDDPERTTDTLFLAGGITGCPDWQAEVIKGLSMVDDLTILNPRRADFPMDNPDAAAAQIAWEYRHLRRANIIAFWFPCETLCPISLYELGEWTEKAPLLFVGTHPDYERRSDIVLQTKLRRHPDQLIYRSLDEMVQEIRTLLLTDFSVL